MDLSEIRAWAVTDSGRYDLVNADDSDNGMDRIIRAASRWLDRKTEVFHQVARVYRTLVAGEFYAQFQEARTITQVAVHTSTKMKGYLEKVPLDELKSEDHFVDPFGSVTAGAPTLFAPVYLRAADTEASDYAGYADWINTIADHNTYNAIIVAPTTDQEYLIEIWGKFFSETLSVDADTNYWSVREPFVLVLATLRQLEVLHRNRQGVMDWEIAIQSELYGMESDFVEDSITGITQLEG